MSYEMTSGLSISVHENYIKIYKVYSTIKAVETGIFSEIILQSPKNRKFGVKLRPKGK